MSDNSSVKVAVRVRPLVSSEIAKGSKDIIDVITENDQIVIKGTDKAFTFNYVLGADSPQEKLYDRCVCGMIDNLFKGYNVTILAYGQTGSGKTHTMGTAYKGAEDMGVIPRAINQIFQFVQDNFAFNFTLTVSFMELYQETLYDLLSDKPREQCVLDIREDVAKGIHIPGLTEFPVNSTAEVLDTLTRGSLGRATASTNMNSQSSRSHAIFTINLCMVNRENGEENKTAKLHLVDLAGSERPKKTGAVGNVFKEGVNINKGLFVLGNVISCLGDEKLQNGFIPYRDSNLTRLLKDSLGGNSITLMIACVSPADYNVDETLSTLRYADRARKIKNKPIVNQDPQAAEINQLKKTIQQLRLQIVGQGGPVVCPAEIELLKKEILDHKAKIRELTLQISLMLNDKTCLLEKMMILQNSNEALNKRIVELKEQCDVTFLNISTGIEQNDIAVVKENLNNLQKIQAQFLEINSEQKKVEMEIRTHEQTTTNLVRGNPNTSIEGSAEINEKQEYHTTRQIAMNTKLEEITQKLALKETLAKQIASNTQYMVDYSAMAENEEKIATLQKEKEELLHQLKNVQIQGAPGKLAEQRRKRVLELESQIQELNKKVQGQARLIKLKEKDEERIKMLNQEIVQMKQAKVKLIRSMREENDKFRQWKTQRERELARLKQEDRRKENQIVKMKAMHTKQQNVFKRKVEEAAALNKRLKEALALRKQAQDSRITGKIERTGQWLKQELDVYVNLVEAEATLTGLLEDRATLQQQYDELKANPTADSVECKSIEEDIELRSVQIQDLQQKILDSDEENKAKIRFDNIQTMAEAKYALKTVFEHAAEIKKKEVQAIGKQTDLQETITELTEKVNKCEEKLKEQEEKNIEDQARLQQSYEEKVAVLLRQLRGVQMENVTHDEELRKRCEILEDKNEQLEKQLSDLIKTKEQLVEKLAVIDSVAKKGNFTPHILAEQRKKKLHRPKESKQEDTEFLTVEEILESDISFDDDNEKDPDWRKTPLGRRILEEKKRLTMVKPTGDLFATKRSSDGGCTCKVKCTARCGCRKFGRACGENCRCTVECENRKAKKGGENDDEESAEASVDEDQSESFKRPRLPDEKENESLVTRRKKKGKKLFTVD